VNFLDYFFWIIWTAGILLVLAYGFVIPFGAPFLPTMKKQRQDALDLLDLKKGQTVVDLGSGDGSILALAAEHGLKAVGYEINPFLWLYSWLRTRRYGRLVKVKLRSFWRADLDQTDGVFVFLITHHMELIDARHSKKPLRVVSHAFQIPGRKVHKKSGALFLYIYK
jgi:SAM-dependent methyltransferase